MPGPYEWGQFEEGYLQWVEEAPTALVKLSEFTNGKFGEKPNHFIIIKYDDPKVTVANAYQDTYHTWKDGASFFNVVLVEDGYGGSARRFQLLDKKNKVIWEHPL